MSKRRARKPRKKKLNYLEAQDNDGNFLYGIGNRAARWTPAAVMDEYGLPQRRVTVSNSTN